MVRNSGVACLLIRIKKYPKPPDADVHSHHGINCIEKSRTKVLVAIDDRAFHSRVHHTSFAATGTASSTLHLQVSHIVKCMPCHIVQHVPYHEAKSTLWNLRGITGEVIPCKQVSSQRLHLQEHIRTHWLDCEPSSLGRGRLTRMGIETLL